MRNAAVRAAISTLSIALAGACSNGNPSAPGDANPANSRDGFAAGPSGLEQRIVTRVDAAEPGSPYTAMLTATSTIVNTSAAPVTLTSRTCLFLEADVETTAKMDRFEPLISCAAVSMAGTLAPGQSIPWLEAHFGVRSAAGTYTLKLRHALSPEFRGEASFTVK